MPAITHHHDTDTHTHIRPHTRLRAAYRRLLIMKFAPFLFIVPFRAAFDRLPFIVGSDGQRKLFNDLRQR